MYIFKSPSISMLEGKFNRRFLETFENAPQTKIPIALPYKCQVRKAKIVINISCNRNSLLVRQHEMYPK